MPADFIRGVTVASPSSATVVLGETRHTVDLLSARGDQHISHSQSRTR
jgi:hypothetical protein